MAAKPVEIEKRTKTYVDLAFKSILSQPQVKELIVFNEAGNPIKSNVDETKSLKFAGYFVPLLEKCRYSLKILDPDDFEVLSLRVRSKYHEVLLIPDGKVTYMATQSPLDCINKGGTI